MTIETKLSKDENLLIISIDGKFDFSMLDEFRSAYSSETDTKKDFIIDMRKTSTIDSSALGMLLNMKRYLNKPDDEIKIINCNSVVEKVLQITNFNKKFSIE